MAELHHLDDTFDSMDEPFGAPLDPFRPEGRDVSGYRGGEGTETASRLGDATVKKLRLAAILCTAVGFLTAIAGLLGVIVPLPLILVVLPGIPLIIAGTICGHIAGRARPAPVTATRLIWRIAPSVGALVGASYSLFFIPEDLTSGMAQAWWLELFALAGMGAPWGSLCALGAWGSLEVVSRVAARFGAGSPALLRELAAVLTGSVVGGIVGFASLSPVLQTDPSQLIFIAIVTLGLMIGVVTRCGRRTRILGAPSRGRPDQRLLLASDRNRVVIVPPRCFRARSKRPTRPKPVARERTRPVGPRVSAGPVGTSGIRCIRGLLERDWCTGVVDFRARLRIR